MVTAMTSHADEAKVQIWASCNWAKGDLDIMSDMFC